GEQQVVKLAEHVGTDCVALVGGDEETVAPLIEEDIEVVVPEIDQRLFELSRAVDRAEELGFGEVVDDDLLRSGGGEKLALQSGVGSADQRTANISRQGGDDGGQLLLGHSIQQAYF